jgi:hypothetical protein
VNKEVPHVDINKLATRKGLLRFTTQLEGLLFGEIPMLQFAADRNINRRRPPLRRADIPATIQALGSLGFGAKYGRLHFWPNNTGFDTINKDDGWHIDFVGPDDGRAFYPHLPSMVLRRHTAVAAPALVQARVTRPAPYGRSGFKHDPASPVYETIQNPGDSVYFIALGGVALDTLIPQAEHSFATIEQTRQIHLGEFEFKPDEGTNAS